MLNYIKRWFGAAGRNQSPQPSRLLPQILSRAQHTVSRTHISKFALRVLYRLHEAGFEAYLVGGGVRDVLLGLHPKDFDVATNARPEQVQSLFQNCRLIGRRFRLAHVYFGGHIVEVATFRATTQPSHSNPHLVHSEHGMLLRDNLYGTMEEDAFRRDFTVNALYYTISNFTLVDYVGGLQDLAARCLRMIGDARHRYREDPVRMLRAIRFAAKLGFNIHADTEAPIYELGSLVKQVPAARLLDEYSKLFLSGHAEKSFELLEQYQFIALLFPEIDKTLKGTDLLARSFIKSALQDTDKRVLEQKPVALPFLLAAFLWYPLSREILQLQQQGMAEFLAFFEACDRVLEQQQQSVAISKRILQGVREIWVFQMRLNKRFGKRAEGLMEHPRFRAAYDFLLLRAKAGEPNTQELATWWTDYIASDTQARALMVKSLKREGFPKRKRKKKANSSF